MVIMKIYNTFTKSLEEFEPITPNKVTMYGCGVTPYKPAHLGHAMQAVIFDVIRRYFEYKGYETIYVRNYTDIDDKIVAKAEEEGIHPLELAKKIIRQSDKDFDSLKVRRATYEPKVSEHIQEIIDLTQTLIDKKHAYATPKGNVYFKVRSFKDYGKLSNRNIDNLEHGIRKDVEDDKQDPLDFALWKAVDKSEELWESPWGHGRPGWHIECSVMSSHYLGDHFDIHGGGTDLVFPHHENEIAQSKAAHDGVFANYWIHNGLLMVGRDKMSKSLSNDITLGEWLEKYHPDVIRYMILTNHYRSYVQFDPRRYSDANKKVYQAYKTLSTIMEKDAEYNEVLYKKLMNEFEDYMDNDFNTVQVIALLHELIKKINKGESPKKVTTYIKVIKDIGNILGLFDEVPAKALDYMRSLELRRLGILKEELEVLLKERTAFRRKREYDKADDLTERLLKMGVKLVDTPEGSSWEPSY